MGLPSLAAYGKFQSLHKSRVQYYIQDLTPCPVRNGVRRPWVVSSPLRPPCSFWEEPPDVEKPFNSRNPLGKIHDPISVDYMVNTK